MNYVIDIIPKKEEKCPDCYETKILGKWSGIGGCYCYNNQTHIHLATDENCNEILNDIFTREPISKHDPVHIIRYKNFQFCIKGSKDNYINLFDKVKEIYGEFYSIKNDILQEINSRSNKNFNKYTDCIKTLLNDVRLIT